MGKNETKKKKSAQRRQQKRYMRAGVLTLLCVLGVGLLAGMAAFNSMVKPTRDMQWYVRDGAVEVAAPAMGEGYEGEEKANSEFLLPEEGMRSTPEPTAEPTQSPVKLSDLRLDATDDVDATLDDADGVTLDADADWDEDADAADVEAPLSDAADDAEAEEEEEIVPAGPVTITISAAGDCTFEGEEGSKSNGRFLKLVKQYGYDYFFSGVRSIFEADDLTIVNLEGPLTTATKRHAHGFVFKADPACVQILSGSSVELCNVANNHSQDYGTAGLKQTAQVLEDAGIGYCGYTAAYQKTIKGVRVIALGFTKWDHTDEEIAKAVAAAREQCDLLIVNVHWGREHTNEQNADQIKTGHTIIDAGADLVLGTHPHVLQGIEYYKGKYIVYSLGNFSFAGNANPVDKRCMIFQQSFGFVPGMGLANCGITDEGINIIPCSVTSTQYNNDFKPMVLAAEQGSEVLKSIVSYSNGFNLKKAHWMKDNYLLANGLIKGKRSQSAINAARTAEMSEETDGTTEDEADGTEGEAAEAAFGAADEDDGVSSDLFAPTDSDADAAEEADDAEATDDVNDAEDDTGDGYESDLFAPRDTSSI